jgi:hypothetical protein
VRGLQAAITICGAVMISDATQKAKLEGPDGECESNTSATIVTTILEVKRGEVTATQRSQRRESHPKKRRAAGVSGHVASM